MPLPRKSDQPEGSWVQNIAGKTHSPKDLVYFLRSNWLKLFPDNLYRGYQLTFNLNNFIWQTQEYSLKQPCKVTLAPPYPEGAWTLNRDASWLSADRIWVEKVNLLLCLHLSRAHSKLQPKSQPNCALELLEKLQIPSDIQLGPSVVQAG